MIEFTEFGGRQMLKRRNHVRVWNRSLNVCGDAAARWDERLEFLADSHERVGHGDDHLAAQRIGQLGHRCCGRVPRSCQHDHITLGCCEVVATRQHEIAARPLRSEFAGNFTTTLRSSRADESGIANRCKSRRQRTTRRSRSADVANAREPNCHVHYRSDVGILAGKRLVITGVLTDASLAFGVAKLAQAEGAQVMLTGAGRGLSITERTARKLSTVPAVAEFDATNPAHIETVREAARHHLGGVDGVLHSIGFAPAACLGDDLMGATWDDVSIAVQVSAFSLKTLADAFIPLMGNGGSIVGLDFDNTVAWPAYNWMGVAKSALESTSRYLARELGPRQIRCNLVAAGPIRTMAAKSIPSFAQFEDLWGSRAPLGWDINDSTAVARACCALLSDWFPATTGEIVHVDGGYHAVGA